MFELCFVLAVISAIGSGIGNFYNKVAVQRGHHKELFVIYGVSLSVPVGLIIAFIFEDPLSTPLPVVLLGIIGGLAATFGIIGKMKTMEHIDVTIFMPLFKTLSPIIVILIGIFAYREWFTLYETVGIFLSLTIPMLLISRFEHTRQNNLTKGMIFTALTSIAAAVTVVIHKYTTDLSTSVLTISALINTGITIGAVSLFLWKNKIKDISSIVQEHTNKRIVVDSMIRSFIPLGGFICFLYALILGGPLSIVYTINSLYVVIPVILSIIIYNEHWNLRKALAVVLSVVALVFFG